MSTPASIHDIFDEKHFQLIVSRIEDYAIYMTDPNGHIMSWNQGAQKIKGYTSHEIIGKHVSVFYTADDRRHKLHQQDLTNALRKDSHESEGWRLRKDGSVFWANVVFTTLYDDNGILLGFAVITRDITRRKKNEDQKTLVNAELERRVTANTEKIVANERRFRALIENSYEGITLLAEDLQILYRSKSAARIIGWSNEERNAASFEMLVHPDDLKLVYDTFEEVLISPNKPRMLTIRALHKSGEYIWLECLLNNRLNDEIIGAVVCNFRNVTERVITQQIIGEKNQQIENILDSITDGFIALDSDFRYTYANRKIGEMVGMDPSQLIGKHVLELFPDAMESDTFKAFAKAKETRQYVSNEDYYAPLNLWQENHIYPSGNGLSVFIRDITERKKAEASLLQSESNLRTVFENTDQAIILFGMDATLLSFNKNAKELARIYFKAEVKVGHSLFEYCLPERASQIKQILQALLVQPSISYEVSYEDDGHTSWYETTWVSVRNPDDKPVGIILTMKDITEKKQADIERDRMTTDLIQRNKDLEQFTYIVSHNLRAPVANIKGLSDLLSHDGDCTTENAAELSALATSVCNLDNVILDLNSILQASNASNDTLEVVSLPDLVNEVMDVNSHLIQKNRATVRFHFDEVTELRSLKSYLYSIFQNLIINSIKYHQPGICPVISINSERNGDKACINFKDNGRGIDLERYGHSIFGLYKRFDLSVEGKGMGLFMVKMQVERLGGKIHVKSRPNEGTAFKLEFPIKN